MSEKPNCRYCHKPIEEGQESTELVIGEEEFAFHDECYEPAFQSIMDSISKIPDSSIEVKLDGVVGKVVQDPVKFGDSGVKKNAVLHITLDIEFTDFLRTKLPNISRLQSGRTIKAILIDPMPELPFKDTEKEEDKEPELGLDGEQGEKDKQKENVAAEH